jgi:predicted transposase/invertase (TIGR01784 family)
MVQNADDEKLGIDPRVDYAFKKVFGQQQNAICLISLLNGTLRLPSPITAVQILNPFNDKEFLTDKLSCVDVRATDERGEIFVVEIQLSVSSGYHRRAVFYACEAFAGQLGAGDDYQRLKATYCISFLLEPLWKDDSQLHHRFQLMDAVSGKILRDTIEIHTVELSKYDNQREKHGDGVDLLDRWVFWMLYAENYSARELKTMLPDQPFTQATDELERIRQKTEDRTMYERRQRAQRDFEWSYRMALLDAVAEAKEIASAEGRAEGRAGGLAEGKAEGKAEGELIGALRGTLNTLEDLLGLPLTSFEVIDLQSTEKIKEQIESLKSRLRDRTIK